MAKDMNTETKAVTTNNEIEDAKKEIAKMLEEAKKEAAKIVSEAKKRGGTEKPADDVPFYDDGNELVTVNLFYDGDKYKDDVFVAVNGERCQIQRGKPVQIKKKFARVIEQSKEQEQKTAELIKRESDRFRDEIEKFF